MSGTDTFEKHLAIVRKLSQLEREVSELVDDAEALRDINRELITAVLALRREFLDPMPDGSWAKTMALSAAALAKAGVSPGISV